MQSASDVGDAEKWSALSWSAAFGVLVLLPGLLLGLLPGRLLGLLGAGVAVFLLAPALGLD